MFYAGASFVLMPGYEPRSYLEALAKYRCTYSRGVAAVFTMFLQHRDALAKLDLSALKGFTIGSAVVTPELMDKVERALPGIKVGASPRAAARSGRPSTAARCLVAPPACRPRNTRCAWSALTAKTATTRASCG